MAWADTFLRPSFRGVPFDVEQVSRAGQRELVSHRVPYTNGAESEDQGLGPRTFRIQAIVFGDDYEDRLAQLITALETPGAGELVHPIHGSVQAVALRWSDDHQADLVNGAAVNIEFVEDGQRAAVFSDASLAGKVDAIATQAEDSRAAADDALVRHIQLIPSFAIPRITAFKDLCAQAEAALGQLLATTGLDAVLSGMDPLAFPRAYVADLGALVDQGLRGLSFGGLNLSFSGSISLGTALGDFNLVRRTLDAAQVVLTPAPAQPDADSLADAAAVQAHARAHAASAIAECTAIVLAGELDGPRLDRADIEAMCGQARAGLQVAIDDARGALDAEGRAQTSAALRALAWQVQETSRAVINQRPPMVSKPSPIGGPVRLVAHAIYRDPTRADEISRLNRLGRNVFIQAGEALNVYSS